MYHALFHFSFFLFPPLPSFCIFALHLFQPAAKQTLPVPSILTGGWKSSLPEIAKIIALQWYFFSLFCRSLHFFAPSSVLSAFKVVFFPSLLFLERLSDSKAFFGKKKRKRRGKINSSLHFFPPHTQGSQDNHLGLCWFSRNVNLTHRLSQCLRKTRNLSRFLARCCRCHRFCEGQKQPRGKEMLSNFGFETCWSRCREKI